MADCYRFVIFFAFVITVANGHPGVGENVTEEEHYNPDADVTDLKDAIDKMNGQQIIDIVTERTSRERLAIVDAYRAAFQLDLIEELKRTLTGSFGEIIVALMTPLHDYYAQELKNAVSGETSDIRTIAEILSTLTNHTFIQTVRASYEKLSNHTLEEDLDHRISDHLMILISGLIRANRSESSEVGGDEVLADALALNHLAFDPNVMAVFKTDEYPQYTTISDNIDEEFTSRLENYFATIFVTRSHERLRRVFAAYEIAYGSIESMIIRKLTKLGEIDLLEFLLVLVKCINSKVDYLAERLYASVAGTRTDDRTLVRIMVTRSEIDLPEIVEAFGHKYGKSLRSWIEEKPTDDYRKALLSVITQVVDGDATSSSSEESGSFHSVCHSFTSSDSE